MKKMLEKAKDKEHKEKEMMLEKRKGLSREKNEKVPTAHLKGKKK